MKLPIYLDYMATTPVDPRVTQKMLECLEISGNFGNSAVIMHDYGRKAQEMVENARAQIASLIHADPKEIIFTSGATEANNLAIKGAARFYYRKGKHIVTCKTEHKSVLDSCQYLESQGFEVTYLTPQKNGLLDLEVLENSLRDDTILLSIMHANNEIGVIQDIEKIAQLTRKRGILFHVDAVQSAGKIPLDLNNSQIDLLSLSAHKIYGPKGIGALYVRRNPRVRLEPLIHGGGHEMGLRSGTLPTHQVVGFGEACTIAKENSFNETAEIKKLTHYLWGQIKTTEVKLNGDEIARVPGNLNISFTNSAVNILNLLPELAVSSGAACTSAIAEPSHVLKAIGVENEVAKNTIRISIGRFTTLEEINFAIERINLLSHRT